MKAWHLTQLGSLDHLRLAADAPDPAPAAGEVVLDVLFAALNPADRYLAEAQYPADPPLPHVLGRDGIGRVVAVGERVYGISVGDLKVIVRGETGVSRPGTFAERVAVSADSLVNLPTGWSHEQAAGATLVYLTAFQAIHQWPELPESPLTLVTGATGGVGVAACQLAKALGHTVVALSRSPEKSARLRELRIADHTLDPADAGWPKRLTQQIGRRVNLAIENIGGPGFNDVLSVMDLHGRISVIGRLAGPVPQFNTASLFFRRLRVGGVAVGSYSREEALDAWSQTLILMNLANHRPLVDRVFPFDQLPQAFAHLAAGPMGKVLVECRRQNAEG